MSVSPGSSMVVDYRVTFYILAFFFVLFFYIAPLFFVLMYPAKGVYSFVVTDSKIVRSLFSLFLFFWGFIFLDLILRFFRARKVMPNCGEGGVSFSFSWVGWLAFWGYILYLVIVSLDQGRTSALYEARQTGGGSWLFLAIQLLAGVVKMALVCSLLNSRKTFMAVFVVSFSVLVEFYSATGRVNMIVNFVVLALIFIGVRARYFSLAMFIAAVVLMPTLLNMKSIIYNVALLGDFEIKSEYFVFDPAAFVDNFGHPLVSMFEVDGLLDIVGYRFFYDYIQGFLFYFKIFGIDFFGNSITYANTMNLLGFEDSVIPPGYMAFGFVQFDYLGVFFSGLFYRWLGWLGELLVVKLALCSNAGVFFVAFTAANTFYHGDVRVMVMTLFFVYAFLYIFVSLFQRRNDLVRSYL